jgi:hypothetical protein
MEWIQFQKINNMEDQMIVVMMKVEKRKKIGKRMLKKVNLKRKKKIKKNLKFQMKMTE